MNRIGAFRVERSTPLSRSVWTAAALLIAVGISMPWWAEPSLMRTLIEFMYLLALAQMWNLLAGYGGLVSIGQQAFVGIGGYGLTVLCLELGFNPFLAVAGAGLITAVFAAATSLVVFRLRGAYFAIGTWVVADAYRLVAANITAWGGGSGTSLTSAMRGIPAWIRTATTFWIALALCVGAMAVVYGLLRSRHGLGLTAVRDSERASASLGVEVRRLKFMVYLISATITGMAGALIYLTKLRISPDAAFTVEWTAFMIFIVVIGGIGTLEGPIIGTIILFALREVMSDLGTWYLIVLGAVAIAVMLKMPEGIWGRVARRFDLHLFPVQRRIVSLKDPAPLGVTAQKPAE